MRLLQVLLFAALSVTAACSLDFDGFQTAGSRDGGAGDGGDLPDASDEACDGGSGRDCEPTPPACQNPSAACTADAGDGGDVGGGGGGKGGGGKGGSGGPTNEAPEVEVIFPPPGVTDRASIAVRGRVSDPEGDAITKLTINGKAAKLKSDGTFSATAPLSIGAHALAIHVEDDGGGEADIDGNEIERFAYLFKQVADMVLDSDHDRVLALDGATDAIIAIALDDGERTVIAKPASAPAQRTSMELDADNNRVLVVERNPGALAWIDLDSGERTTISDASNGGTFEPHTAVLDPVNTNRAFVAVKGNDDGYNSDVLVTVDLATGTRTPFPISGPNILNYGQISDLVYDEAHAQLLLMMYEGLIAVTVADGSAHWIANAGRVPPVGHGTSPFNVHQMALDGDRVLAFGEENLGSGPVCVYEISLDGAVTELAALTIGKDVKPLSLYDTSGGFVYEPATGDALILDLKGQLLRVRLEQGHREYVSTNGHGDGLEFDRPMSIADDAGRNRWIVADDQLNALIAVDKRTGDRSVISDASSDGPAFDGLVAIVYSPGQDYILALESQRLFSVDPVSGARTVIASDVSGSVVGTGISFTGALDVETGFDGNSAVVINCFGSYPCASQLIAIDLATGNRTLKSGSGTGTGPLEQFVGLARGNGVYLVATQDFNDDAGALLSIDGNNGNRTVIADAVTGDGPALSRVQAVTYDSYENRAVVINEFATPQKLVGVDLITGDRKLLTAPENMPGRPYPGIISDLIVDVPTHRLLIANGWGDSDAGLMGIQLADRERSLIGDQSRGPWSPSAMLLDPDRGVLYGAELPLDSYDTSQGVVIKSIDVRTSEVSTVSDDADSGGTRRWTFAINLALDADENRLIGATFANAVPHAIVGVDLDDGEQTVISNDDGTTGTRCQYIYGMAWDAESKRILLSCPGLGGIVAIDREGVGSVLSDPDIGEGDPLQQPFWLTVDAERNRVFVIDLDTIVAIDLETGDRTMFAGPAAGTGPDLVTPATMVIDSAGGRVLVLDTGNDDNLPALIAIDLEDKTRSLVTRLPSAWYNAGALTSSVAFDAENQILYAGALFAFDLVSGQYISIAGNP